MHVALLAGPPTASFSLRQTAHRTPLIQTYMCQDQSICRTRRSPSKQKPTWAECGQCSTRPPKIGGATSDEPRDDGVAIGLVMGCSDAGFARGEATNEAASHSSISVPPCR